MLAGGTHAGNVLLWDPHELRAQPRERLGQPPYHGRHPRVAASQTLRTLVGYSSRQGAQWCLHKPDQQAPAVRWLAMSCS